MDQDYYHYIRGWFEKRALFYNFIAFPLTGVREKVADLVDEEDKIKILDVCTGTGTQAFAFAKRGYEVFGLDLSREMLKIAEKNKKNKYENVRFVMADATKMPFENDYFDYACISFGLHEMPHEVRHQVLDEMKRVSRKIIVVDYHIPKNKLHRWPHMSFASLYESKYYRDFAKRDLEELLRDHGLKVVTEAYGLEQCTAILGSSILSTATAAELKRKFQEIGICVPKGEIEKLILSFDVQKNVFPRAHVTPPPEKYEPDEKQCPKCGMPLRVKKTQKRRLVTPAKDTKVVEVRRRFLLLELYRHNLSGKSRVVFYFNQHI
jgi:demethylmenaquinone methyltransferase/2-methoxy-6-polyprenyl-1,4-benzoquinol methylase